MAAPRNHRVQIMDTTLRDGEQTPDVAYTPDEKLQLARILLDEVGVDRIEIAGTRVSEGEREAARQVARWARKKRLARARRDARLLRRRAPRPTGRPSVGGRAMNLLVKGSERHCRSQLRMSPEKHRDARRADGAQCAPQADRLNVYLEDWSNGVRDSFDYVFAMVQQLLELGVERIYLADTLGILAPDDTTPLRRADVRPGPTMHFEFHGHNDYGLANANCLAAVEAGARGVHTSVNGMGERAGNTRLAEIVAALHDHSRVPHRRRRVAALVGLEARRDVPAARTSPRTRRSSAATSSRRPRASTPTATRRATSTRPASRPTASAGAATRSASSRARRRSTRTSRASASRCRPRTRDLVLRRIVELGDKKHTVVPEDLPFIIADVLKTPDEQLVRVTTTA